MLQILKRPGAGPLTAALFAVGALTGASQVWASTAATATVRNVVTVAYNNAAGTAQTPLVASVDVTINLVQAAATLAVSADVTTAPGTDAVYTYTITNGANGISTYTPTASIASETDIGGSTLSATPAITLGATTVTTGVSILAATPTVITVPRDGSADSSVNGLADGDTVVIGGLVYAVSGIVDVQAPVSPSTAVTTTITVTGPAQVVTAGMLIVEQQTFTLNVTPGTMTSTSDAHILVDLSVTDGTNVTNATQTDTTVAAVGLSVTKLVRNVTNAVVGGGLVNYGGQDYYANGVTGNPGEVLEYLIVVSKSASASSATSVVVTDPIPVFTTFLTTAYAAASGLAIDNAGAGTFTNMTNAADPDAGEFAGNNVTFRPGATAGTMGASAVSRMKFQVTIQ